MLLRFQKAAVRGNYETGNQAFSMRLRFLTIRGRSPTSGGGQRATGGTPCLDGRRQPSLGGTSRMNREVHVRICGGLGVKFPGPTRQTVEVVLSEYGPDLSRFPTEKE